MPARTDKEEDPLSLLASISEAFSSNLDLEETLENAVSQIMHYMQAEAASVFLLDESKTTLTCRASAGTVKIDGMTLSINHGIVGRSVREKSVQFIRDVDKDPNFAGFVDEETGFKTRSILCAPLSVKGECLGAMEVINRDTQDGLFDDEDVRLLKLLASSASLVIHNANMAKALIQQERIKKELQLAREIQASLLPVKASPQSTIAGINIPALEVSGDFYDYYKLKDGRVGFNLGDVSGKGMNAALLMAKTCSLLRCLGKEILDPSELLAKVNEELCESSTRGMFVTLVAGIYDPEKKLIIFSNAGHQPPLIMDSSGDATEYPATSPPLGIMSGVSFDLEEENLNKKCLYLFTDGITEGQGVDGKEMGVDGFKMLIEQYKYLPPVERIYEVVKLINSQEVSRKDDVTLLVIEGQSATDSVTKNPRIHFYAIPEQLAGIRNWLLAHLRVFGLNEKDLQLVILAVNEASMNIIQHGYKGDPAGEIILEIIDNRTEIEISLVDFAQTLDIECISHRPLDDIRPGGLGTYFIDEIMDNFEYSVPESGIGNKLIMKKKIYI